MELLRIENLKTYFETKKGYVKAVDDVSFSLNYGESIGLIGESGCGKTTIALSITKLLPNEGRIIGGKILFEGENILELNDEEIRKKRWKDTSIIFQGAMNALNPVIKVGDQIAEAIVFHEGVSKDKGLKRVKELFELVEMKSNRINEYPHEFSGGMKQRVMIAMALACNPKLVIGDEPTTGLDVMVQSQILNLLDKLRKEFNMGFIFITHDLSIISETCDRVAVMYAGKVVEIGRVENILNKAIHPYTKKLLSAFPNINGPKKISEAIPGIPPNLITPPTGCRFHPRCEFASDICKSLQPEMQKAEEGHYFSCYHGDV